MAGYLSPRSSLEVELYIENKPPNSESMTNDLKKSRIFCIGVYRGV